MSNSITRRMTKYFVYSSDQLDEYLLIETRAGTFSFSNFTLSIYMFTNR